VASARAHGKRLGRVYKGAGGQLRGRGVNHVAGAHAAWAARRCDVRRRGGQWRAAIGTPASGNQPPGTVQTLAIVTNSSTPGAAYGPLGLPVLRRTRAARVRSPAWHERATSRVGTLWHSRCICVSLSRFKNSFFQIFKLKCTLWYEEKLKIRHSSTSFTKVGRGLVQAIEQERHANLAKFSAPVNIKPGSCFAIFTLLHSKPAMPLNSKVACLEILHIFPFGWF
jgi:hypothetical protein